MSYQQFQALIQHSSPAFVCKPAGGLSKAKRFTAKVTHDVRPAASPSDLARLARLIPVGAEQLCAFYARHDGFVLYRDTHSPTAGVELYRVADMEERTGSMREWLDMMFDDEEDADEDADEANPLKTAIAIGESPMSGNYFAMTIEGPQTGKVFFIDHDDWREEPIADSFDQFLALVCTSPASLLSETLGCTARYFDGRSDIQWIPIEYLPSAPAE